MNRTADLVSMAIGLVLLVTSGFFLLTDDPSLADVGEVLTPLVLLAAGSTLVVGSLRRR